MMRPIPVVALAMLLPGASIAQSAATPGYLNDSSLVFLTPLIGAWHPLALPDSLKRLDPPIVAHDYRWSVGGKAIQIRESFRQGRAQDALLAGLVYWNPATERVEFVTVAGPGPGEGRMFTGEYRALDDGTIERTYDVFYRTLADVPGESFGGLRRRYRERYRMVTRDSIASTLEWFHEGTWRPFGRFARHGFTRIPDR